MPRAGMAKLRPIFRRMARLVTSGRDAVFISNTRNVGTPTVGLTPIFSTRFADTGSIADAKGNSTVTFTRATIATVLDQDNIVRTAVAGEARFQGLRRVQNNVVGSENIAVTGASTSGGTGTPATCTSGFIAPDNSRTAFRVQANIGAGVLNADFSAWQITATVRVGSCWMKSNTGASQSVLTAFTGTGNIVTIDNVWRRYTWANAGPASALVFGCLGNLSSSKTIDILVWHPQSENDLGQAVAIPADYVSTGVLTAPYQGANVDGVQYFPTHNGNVVQQNLLLRSQEFDNAAWTARGTASVTANATTAPDGTLTADLLSGIDAGATNDIFQIVILSLDGLRIEPSFYIKRVSTSGTLSLFNPQNSAAGNWQIDLSLLSNGWERITRSHPAVTIIVEHTTINGGGCGFHLRKAGAAGAISFYAWGAQVQPGRRTGTYVATAGAAVNNQIVEEATGDLISSTIRFGYLDEGASTNLVLRSSDFANAAWINIGTPVVVSDSTIAPDGTTTADTLTDDDVAVFEGKQQVFVVPNDGTSYTASIYVLKTSGGTSKTFGINFSLTGGTSVVGNFRINTDTGAILAGTGTVKSIGNYWRISTPVINNTSGNTSLTVQYYPATAANNQSLDDGTQTGSAVVWEAQVEALAFASSTIPTVAATVTRNVDLLTYTLPKGYTDTAGTWVAKAGIVPGNINNNRVVGCNVNTATALAIAGAPATTGFSIFDGINNNGSGVVNFTNAMHKGAGAWDANGIAVSTDGAAVGSAAYDGTMFSGNLSIGGQVGVSWWGCIDFVEGYPYRLTNSMLQTFST